MAPGARDWDAADLESLEILRPLLDAGGYLPWTEGALRPAAAFFCNERTIRPRLMRLVTALSSLRASWMPETIFPEAKAEELMRDFGAFEIPPPPDKS